jgi:hypothetical protein
MPRRRFRPAQTFAILPSLRQANPSSFPQNLSFELREYGKQTGHRATGGCGQIQGLGQGDEADAEMIQFLKCGQQICYRSVPAIQAPHQHDIDFPPPLRFQQSLSCLSHRRAGADFTYLQRDHPTTAVGILAHGPVLHGESLLIIGWRPGHRSPHETFSLACVTGRKRGRILLCERPVLWAFHERRSAWPQRILFGQTSGPSYYAAMPRGRFPR